MTESDFDASKFAAEVLIQATEQTVKAAARPFRTALRRTIQGITDAYRPFLFRTHRRVSTIRTFLRPSESVDLLEHYVPVDLRTKSTELSVDEMIERLATGERFVISALAGGGKSVLMRYIALSFFHNPRGRIPLFYELRSLNTETPPTILSAIHEFYRGNSGIEFEDFLRALRSGYFILILDGFDEISPQHRNVFEKEIMHIAREFEKLPLIISGRHDERFNSWEPFNHFSLKSMTHAQTRLLIKKSNYDQEVKTVFLDRLTEDFFDQHQSFLENPLLAIMMMLTFEGYAEIPESLHEFYRIAFDTLMRRHDALKGQFLRESHSSCSTEQFKQLFSSFSLLTYSKSAFSFDRDRALLFIKAAITQQGLEKDESLVLTDLIESICLLQQEGFEVSFVHRSFQEYFSAVFISSSASGFVKKYLDEADFQTFDNVLPMLMGIAQQRVESEWAVDKVAELCGRFPETGSDSESELLVAAFPEFDFMIVNAGAVLTRIQQTKLARELRILETLYPDRFQIEDAEEEEERTLDYYVSHRWERRIADALVEMEDAGCDQLNGVGKAISTVHEKSDGGDRVKFKVLTDKMSGPLFDAVFGSRNRDYVGSLHRIASLQQDRRSRSDRFLGEVFGPIDV